MNKAGILICGPKPKSCEFKSIKIGFSPSGSLLFLSSFFSLRSRSFSPGEQMDGVLRIHPYLNVGTKHVRFA